MYMPSPVLPVATPEVELSRYPTPADTYKPYTECPPAVVGSAAALAAKSCAPLPPGPSMVRLLWREVWSKISVMEQEVPEQNEFCAAALAYPPAARVPMFVVAPSDHRLTWYRLPLYA